MSRNTLFFTTALLCLPFIGKAQQGPNLLNNPGFESGQDRSSTSWNALLNGYTVDTQQANSGNQSLRMTNLTALGISSAYQTVPLNQKTAKPILISGWSRAENISGAMSNGYSLYADVTYTDGTKLYGQAAQFAVGTHGWQQATKQINATKPVAFVTLHALFRFHSGSVWFDDLSVSEISSNARFDKQPLMPPTLPANATSGWYARDVAANSAVVPLLDSDGSPSADADQLQLRLANLTQKSNGKIVEGTLQDTSGRTRAITLYYVERVQGDKLTWWNDIRRTAAIGASGEYSNTFSVKEGVTGTTSFYPFGCVTGPGLGRAIGIPPLLGPRISRIGYNADADLLYVAFDVALTGQNIANSDGAGHGSADVAIVRYNVDPTWGFRDTARQYYALFPDVFTRRATAEGIWLPFADPTTIANSDDFGFAFHEGNYTVKKDDKLGIGSFRYSVPMNYEMPMAASVARTYDAAIDQLRKDAKGKDKVKAPWARAVLNSCTMALDSLLNVVIRTTSWNDGATWIVNPNPNIPNATGQETVGSLLYTKAMGDSLYNTAANGVLDGEFLDGIEANRDVLDFCPTSLTYAVTPPTFTTNTFQPVLPEWFNVYELASFMSQDLRQRGKLLMANGTAWRIHQFVSLIDVPGAEVEWMNNGVWKPDNDPQFNFRRTMAYQKPYLLLQNTDFDLFGTVQVEKYFQRSLFYGCYPSMFHGAGYSGYYWQTPALYNRDRALFKKYIPLIAQLSQAGWEPVTYARSDDANVFVERYGNQYLTLFNGTASAEAATITINLDLWNLASSTVQIVDDITGQNLGTFPTNGDATLTLSVGSEKVRMLHVIPQ